MTTGKVKQRLSFGGEGGGIAMRSQISVRLQAKFAIIVNLVLVSPPVGVWYHIACIRCAGYNCTSLQFYFILLNNIVYHFCGDTSLNTTLFLL